MMTLILIGLIVMLGLLVVTLTYRSRAQQAEHVAQIQKTIADAALSQTQHREALDKSIATLEQTQRQETINETNPKHLAARTDLDNDYSGDDATGLHDDNSPADYRNSPADADSTGATVHYVNRPDLSDG